MIKRYNSNWSSKQGAKRECDTEILEEILTTFS